HQRPVFAEASDDRPDQPALPDDAQQPDQRQKISGMLDVEAELFFGEERKHRRVDRERKREKEKTGSNGRNSANRKKSPTRVYILHPNRKRTPLKPTLSRTRALSNSTNPPCPNTAKQPAKPKKISGSFAVKPKFFLAKSANIVV